MVKIRDLSDKQLLSQLEKYEKIYLQLKEEREKRVERGTKEELLLTLREKKELEEISKGSNIPDEKTQAFHLKFDDDEIETMENARKEQALKDEDDEVRVTQLLKLSKEQLAELRNPKVKKVTKKKKVRKASKK